MPAPEPTTDWFDTKQGSGSLVSAVTASARLRGLIPGSSLSEAIGSAGMKAYLSGSGESIVEGSGSGAFPVTAPVQTTYSVAGGFTYAIPYWCKFLDVVLLGGGGGGGGHPGFSAGIGKGGGAGSWVVVTLVRGVDIGWTVASLAGSVGAAGAKNSSNGGSGTAGGSTTLTTLSLLAAGGAGGQGNTTAPATPGGSPGDRTVSGIVYAGGNGGAIGVPGTAATPGAAPGAGGGGGSGGLVNGQIDGANGSLGRAWIRAYQ